MSSRTLRRTFATPFVVTLTASACTVQSGPPPSRPVGTAQPPGHGDPTGPSDPNGLGNRPDDRAQMGTAATAQTDTSERRWTVSRQGGKCTAYTKVQCPPNTACNPPRPTEYACTGAGELAEGGSINVVRWAGSATCMIEVPPANCPPEMSCNPPPPRQVACPK